jgi:nucleotide-binding universal stress UspA family protein
VFDDGDLDWTPIRWCRGVRVRGVRRAEGDRTHDLAIAASSEGRVKREMTAVPAGKEEAGDMGAGGHVGRPTIVVGVDGSTPSWDAFAWAAGEALRSGGRIVAVFVSSLIDPGEALGSTAPLGYSAAVDARDEVAQELADEVARRADTLGVEVRFVRGLGDASRALAEVARSERADLMVVGRSAKMLHRLIGSVSRRLVLKHDGPVIVVVP